MFTLHLKNLFKTSGLIELKGQVKVERRYERQMLEEVVHQLLQDVFEKSSKAPEEVREVLGSDISKDEDGESESKRRWFTPIATKQTLQDYVKRIGEALVFYILLTDRKNREKGNIKLPEETLVLIEKFKESDRKKEDILNLVCGLLLEHRGHWSMYNSEILCLYPITQLISESKEFSLGETAQKTISSLKYLCRGAVLHRVFETNEELTKIPVVQALLYKMGSCRPFAKLNRLHKGVCSISGRAKQRLTYFFEQNGSLLVDGIDFSPSKLAQTFRTVLDETRSIPQIPNDVRTLSSAKRFLRSCLAYEHSALMLLHLLLGGSARATDYKNLKVDDFKKLSPELILVTRVVQKNTLLRKKEISLTACVPYEYFQPVLQYWSQIRPHCVNAAKFTGKSHSELKRWKGYSFVHGSGKKVRKVVGDKLLNVHGSGAGFQRLRHASEAIFRHMIVPREFQIRSHYNFDQLFGHTYRTGLSYGVLNLMGGSSSRDKPEDISSIIRCLKGFWKLLTKDPTDGM